MPQRQGELGRLGWASSLVAETGPEQRDAWLIGKGSRLCAARLEKPAPTLMRTQGFSLWLKFHTSQASLGPILAPGVSPHCCPAVSDPGLSL